MLIAEHISRLRTTFKLVNADVKATDRYIYSLMKKHRDWLIKQRDSRLQLMRLPQLFQVLPCEDLIEVDSVQCCGIQTNCTIKRTKNRVPEIVEAYSGPIIRNVTSIDGQIVLDPTTPQSFLRKKKKKTSKYDPTRYYWFSEGYLYFPDIPWDAIRIEAYFSENISLLKCDEYDKDPCKNAQEYEFYMPSDLAGRMDDAIYQDLNIHIQIPSDNKIDSNDNTK